MMYLYFRAIPTSFGLNYAFAFFAGNFAALISIEQFTNLARVSSK